MKHRVKYWSIARQRLGKHIPAEAYVRNNRSSIAMQRISKQAYLPIERLCFLRRPYRGVIKETKNVVWGSCLEFGRVLEMEAEGDWEEMRRNELDCAKKTSSVIGRYSEMVISPLPGYD
jgi:hypothetical protein